jgi:hypothetical protein
MSEIITSLYLEVRKVEFGVPRSVRLLILKSILNRELNIYLDHITELI